MAVPGKIGRYEILEELGHGAMGAVYRAKDPAMDRMVAVKTILSVALASTQENEFRERFYREARAAGGLAHPGIVPIFDVGEHEGMPYLVMEFINGRTLDDVVKKGERLSLERACDIGQRIAEALGYAHQHGVVHRDIKPANILLTSRETYGIERPKIADFGVAKLAEGRTTLTGALLGTPAFMPPEQFTGGPIDGRADIFSLGVVLYWMFTGEQPFPGESLTAVSYKVVHTEPVPPRKLNPWLPMELEHAVMKCLAKSPDDRYQTAEELAQELGRIREQGKGGARKQVAPEPVRVDPNAPTMAGMGTMAATAAQPALSTQPAPLTAQPATVAASAPSSTKATSRSRTWVLLIALAVVVVGASGWFALRARTTPSSSAAVSSGSTASANSPAPAATPVSAPVAPDTPTRPAPLASDKPADVHPANEKAAPPTSATPKKPSPATAASAASTAGLTANVVDAKSSAKSGNLAASKAPAAAEPAAPDFNPRDLDPKTNAKLKIEWKNMPNGVEFQVEMNGKLYTKRTGAGGSAQDDELYVPPGVQEFRITASSGQVRKTSNTVSGEFKAKKRLTLRVEVREPGVGQGTPQGLYSDTQIVAALK